MQQTLAMRGFTGGDCVPPARAATAARRRAATPSRGGSPVFSGRPDAYFDRTAKQTVSFIQQL
ncbi:hypothetical protein E2R28_14240 [Burkholderia pseudomallei]|uniref:hypothetical protein n=1 Tax=Burkholderia pseudomallei TaxID=28450 RepID=UPI001065B727|nr:hypothetical protein [Burkholderia pseudomallei]QBP49280.1 hypothetical protein E2R28_14240 [Burkholderia pseudomallei]